MKYQWIETKHPRSGSIEYKLDCPLMRGEHRPNILVCANGEIYATAISGYNRRFDNLDEAKEWAGRLPEIAGFIRN
jgi:hypothetical protein